MAQLGIEDIRRLAITADSPLASLYFPTFPGGPEIGQKNSVRLKNLLRRAHDNLAAHGVARAAIEAQLAPAQELLSDDRYWRNQGEGFAGLASPGAFESFRLPFAVAEEVSVGSRFYLKPLLPALVGDGRFYVLALSQNRTRLLEGSMSSLRELDARAIPSSLLDAVGYDWQEGTLQFHGSASGAGSQGRPAFFHGQGAGGENSKAELEKFLRVVDRAVVGIVRDRQAPLVVAAAEPLLSMYRDLSKHPTTLARGVEGNPDHVSPAQLHRQAWELVEPSFLQTRRDARARFVELAGTGRASGRLQEILPAVFDGRVETIFVATDQPRWGRYDPETRTVELAEQRRPTDHDLLDVAAVEALLRSSCVYAVPAERVPGDGSVAAIFRY